MLWLWVRGVAKQSEDDDVVVWKGRKLERKHEVQYQYANGK